MDDTSRVFFCARALPVLLSRSLSFSLRRWRLLILFMGFFFASIFLCVKSNIRAIFVLCIDQSSRMCLFLCIQIDKMNIVAHRPNDERYSIGKWREISYWIRRWCALVAKKKEKNNKHKKKTKACMHSYIVWIRDYFILLYLIHNTFSLPCYCYYYYYLTWVISQCQYFCVWRCGAVRSPKYTYNR